MNPSQKCPKCQRSYPSETKVCPVCNVPLEEIPEPAAETPHATSARPEGKTVKDFNTVDASGSQGPVAVGSGARAVQVSGGMYIENQQVTYLPPEEHVGVSWQVPFPRNKRFVGRKEHLEELQRLLAGQPRLPVGVHGMGGMGKTQLAVEFAFQHKDDYPHGVFWLTAPPPGESNLLGAWQSELARLGRGLGYKLNDPNRSDAGLLLAQTFLAHVQQNPQALLVVDNLSDAGQLFQVWTQTLSLAALPCALIFTTHQRNRAVSCAWLGLAELPEEDALRLLLRHEARRSLLQAGHPQHTEALRLAQSLGCLPLALWLAGAYLDKYLSITPGQYLQRIEKYGVFRTIDDTRLRREDLPTGHVPALAATLGLQWDALAEPEARLALQTAALFAEGTPLGRGRLALFSGLAEEPPEAGFPSPLEEALAALADGAWVEELDERQVRLHPLVSEFALSRAADLTAFRRAAAGRAAAALADPVVLEAGLVERGVDSILEDLRLALAFAGDEDLAGAPGWPGVRGLYRALLREAHTLRRWDPGQMPGFCLQQWRRRALQGAWLGLAQRCEQELEARRLEHLSDLHPPGGESEALICTLAGYSGGVNAVAVTPDGQRAVSAGDHTLKVWDLASGACLATLVGHSSEVNAVVVTPDGQRAVSGSWDHTLKVWNLASGTCLATLVGHSDSVTAVAVTPDSQRGVSGSRDHTLKVWDLASGACLATLEGHSHEVTAVAVTPDGKKVVSGSWDNTLKVWDLASGACLYTLAGHSNWVTAVAVTPDGRQAVSGSFDNTLKVWDLASRACLATLAGHSGPVNAVAVTPDGQQVVSGGWDHTLKVWDLASEACLATLVGHSYEVRAVAVTPDGQRAVSASWDKTLKVWDLASEACLATLVGHSGEVTAVVVTPDGQRVVSGSYDHTLKVWDLASGLCLATPLAGWFGGVAVTPDGQLAVSGEWDYTLKVWDLASGVCLATLAGHSESVTAVAITPNGQLMVSGSWDHTLKVWGLASGLCLATLVGHSDHVTAVVVTPDGQRAVSGSYDHTLKVWDLASGLCLATLAGHSYWVRAVAVTPDGKKAISGSWDHTLKVWDLASGLCLATLAGHSDTVEAVVVTPDGQRAVSGSWDHTLKVWDLASGACRLTYEAVGSISSLAITPDGRFLVAGDVLGQVHFLEMHLYS